MEKTKGQPGEEKNIHNADCHVEYTILLLGGHFKIIWIRYFRICTRSCVSFKNGLNTKPRLYELLSTLIVYSHDLALLISTSQAFFIFTQIDLLCLFQTDKHT